MSTLKPSEYRVGARDAVGNTIKSIIGKSEVAVVYTTDDRQIRWEYADDGTLPSTVRPSVQHFDSLTARIRVSGMTQEQRETAYVLAGQCLFQALNAGDPDTNPTHFSVIEAFLAQNAPAPSPNRSWPARFVTALGWPARTALVVGFLIAACVAWAVSDAWVSGRQSSGAALCEPRAGADELVVLVHGYNGSLENMDGVIQAIRQQRPKADILFFSYPASTFSNANAFALAAQLEEAIHRHDHARYTRIILSGYSMGGLLARKAYVYGCGNVEDLPIAGPASTVRPARAWCRKVERIVLLAGMNRGWNPEARPESMSWLVGMRNQLGRQLARLTSTGRLIRSFERGEPFVANLRIQWLNTMEKAREGLDGLHMPVVIQLLGDRDDVVSKEDSRDVKVARDFIWVTVNNTGHADLIRLSEAGDGLERRQRIRSAFGHGADVEALRLANPAVTSETDPDVTTVVFVLHGIRDMGEWTSQFKIPLETAFADRHQESGEKIHVHRAGYGYFPMGSFLLFGDRQKNVRWFMDQLTEMKARFPKLKQIHFVGHSNGTYVLAGALAKYQTLHVGRVVFAGSVVRRDFAWSEYSGRLQGVRNYVASADWVVALFPKLFELPGFRFLNPDLGSAGFNGFEDGFVKDYETQFVRGGHGAALAPENVQSIVDFILDGERRDVPELIVDAHPRMLDLLSRVCWLVWMGLTAGLVYIGAQLPRWINRAKPETPRAIPGWRHPWSIRTGYILAVWLILLTV